MFPGSRVMNDMATSEVSLGSFFFCRLVDTSGDAEHHVKASKALSSSQRVDAVARIPMSNIRWRMSEPVGRLQTVHGQAGSYFGLGSG